jgi:hypothetical protein
LAETAAAELHRARRSSGFDALLLDAKDSGQMIAHTRREIEGQLGRPIVSALNNLSDGSRAQHRAREHRETREHRELAA